jgi:hypothetical protein
MRAIRQIVSKLRLLASRDKHRGLANDDARHSVIFSFVVDSNPKFAYQGYHLARSLIEHCGNEPASRAYPIYTGGLGSDPPAVRGTGLHAS